MCCLISLRFLYARFRRARKSYAALPQGIKLRMVTGQIVEILENAGNGANLLCRFVENEENPSSVGEEEYVFFTDVKEVVEEGAS